MQLETWSAPPGDVIPNHPRFPVLLYRGVERGDARQLLAAHGWGGSWVDGVFDFHHFHSTSHEVLAVIAGSATLELGGPQGEAFEVAAGDVIVLPAGTGHRRASADGAFRVVGAYPKGQEDYDLLREADDAGASGSPPSVHRPRTRWAERAWRAGADRGRGGVGNETVLTGPCGYAPPVKVEEPRHGYEDWNKDDLQKRAAEIGVKRRARRR